MVTLAKTSVLELLNLFSFSCFFCLFLSGKVLGSLGPVFFAFHLQSNRIRFRRRKGQVFCGERNNCAHFKRAM